MTKVQPKASFVHIKVPSSVQIKKPKVFNTSIDKHSLLVEVTRPSNLINKSYNEMVGKTMQWIKTREVENQFVNYQENSEAIEFEVAEKLLMRAIFTNYQLKRELLNERLAKATNEKEAMDYVVNSKEWEQMQQFEKWTAEFLKKHPQTVDTSSSFSSLKDRLIVY